ncbi:MAG: hypothetical protein LKE40_07535 [Spirochaetia bacterium]|jgi:hypothetical protein|nr:hypothetical protein [Spirochaetia bacterium]
MKKKVLLTTTAMALIAAMTVSADVNFSGKFRQGYKFSWTGSDYTADAYRSSTASKKEGKLTFKINDADGLWSVSFGDLNGTLDSNDKLGATATINFSQALKAQKGIELPVGVVLGIGNTDNDTQLTAYDDVTGNEYYKFKNYAAGSVYTGDAIISYENLASVKLSVNPVNVSYGEGEDAVSYRPSMAVSAKISPVDGISATAGYAYRGFTYDQAGNTLSTEDYGFNGSALVDVAKFAGLDSSYKLSVSAYESYLSGTVTKTTSSGTSTGDGANQFAINVDGGVGDISAYAEFLIGTLDSDSTYAMNTCVTYSGIEDTSLDIYLDVADFDNFADTIAIGGDAAYTLGGATYNLNMEYDTASGDDTFSVTPKVTIYF